MFNFRLLIIIVTVCLTLSHCKLDKYCSICRDHTLCQYHGLGKECTDPGESGVSEAEKKEILDLHNWYRSLVAGGLESKGAGGGQPKAADMMKLVWDNELQKVAQRWADQCHFGHDTCRDDPRWKVGQNVFWKFKSPVHHVNWTEAIASWYNEVLLFNPNYASKYTFEPETGHYTQMVWHDSYAIGCGRRDYGLNKLYICNYGPTGNWIDEPMYLIGEPCSQCPKGTVCEDFLCATVSKKIGVRSGDLQQELLEGTNSTSVDDLKLPPTDGEEINSRIGGEQDALVPEGTIDNTIQPETESSIDIDEATKNEVEDLKRRLDELVRRIIGRYSIKS